MRRFRHGATMFLFLAALVALGVANLIWGRDAAVSLQERRTLAEFPSLTWEDLRDGRFAEDFDAWFSDHFVLRDPLLGLSDGIRDLRGFATAGGVELVSVGRGNRYGQAPTTAADTQTATQPAPPPVLAAPYVDEYLRVHLAIKPNPIQPPDDREQIVNDYLVVDDSAMEILSFRQSAADYYASCVAYFVDHLPADIPVFLALIPTHIAVVDRVRFARIGADQASAIQYTYSLLPKRVTAVDALSALYEHRDEYIYFRTDHHWTALGAYYVYREIARSAGVQPVALETLQRGELHNFLGTLYDLTHSARLLRNPDTVYYWPPTVLYTFVVYPEPKQDELAPQPPSAQLAGEERQVIDLRWNGRGNKYQVFLSGDTPLSVVQVPDGPNHRLLVIKDSYGNALVPWLVPHAREIYVVDPRTFQGNAIGLVEEHRIDAVLFVNTFGIMAYYGGYARGIRRIVDYVPPPPTDQSAPQAAEVQVPARPPTPGGAEGNMEPRPAADTAQRQEDPRAAQADPRAAPTAEQARP